MPPGRLSTTSWPSGRFLIAGLLAVGCTAVWHAAHCIRRAPDAGPLPKNPFLRILTNSQLEGHTGAPPRSGIPSLVVLAVSLSVLFARAEDRFARPGRGPAPKLTTKSPTGRDWSSGL